MPEPTCSTTRNCVWRAADTLSAKGQPTSPNDLCIAISRNGEPCGRLYWRRFGADGDDDPGQPLCERHAALVAADIVEHAKANAATKAAIDAEAELAAKEVRKRKQQRKARGGYVYFARRGHKVKIGFTTSLKRRIPALEFSAGAPFDEVVSESGTRAKEQRYHRRFSDHRQMGEWFDMTPEIRDLMDSISG